MPPPRRKARRPARKPASAAAAGLSVRAFARRLGVSHTAIQKGIASGRLRESIGGGKHGRPFIKDPELATKEWTAGATKPGPVETPPGGQPEGAPATLTEAQRRVQIQREAQLALDNDQKRGRLVDAVEAKRDAFRAARAVRDSVLNVVDRVAADLAAEVDVDRVHRMLTAELRKALEDASTVIAAFEAETGEADE
jgi:hypothetical protein